MSRIAVHIIAAALIQAVVASVAFGAAINGSTLEWSPVFYGLVDPDPANDHQTGQAEADIVGTSTITGFYTQYDVGLSPLVDDDTLSFRLRLGTEESPSGFSHIAIIGVDGDLDGTNDAFIMLDNSGQDEIALYTTGNKANDSPKSTSTKSTSYSYTPDSTNYDWSPVSSSNCYECTGVADYDLDGDGFTDHFLSFRVSFVDLVAVLAMDGVTGVTPDTIVQFIAGTSTNTNSFNQDLVGVDGDAVDTELWTVLNAVSTQDSILPSPEPGTGVMLGLGLCWLGAARRSAAGGTGKSAQPRKLGSSIG